jgi:hypothetical protein
MIVKKQLSPLQGSPKNPVFPGIRFAHPGLFSAAPPARAFTGLKYDMPGNRMVLQRPLPGVPTVHTLSRAHRLSVEVNPWP